MSYEGVSYVTIIYSPGAETFRMRIGKRVFRAIGMPERVDLKRVEPGVVAIVPGVTFWTNGGANPRRTAVISMARRVFNELGLCEGVYTTTVCDQAIMIRRSESTCREPELPSSQ